jgi:prepilin-type N-terminal cleavage/methylation domain-containing protein
MTALRRSLERRIALVKRSGERGVTLIELLVSMIIFAILLTLVGGAFSTISKAVTLSGQVNSNIGFSSLGMNEISKVLRFAATNPVLNQPIDNPAFVVAKPETLTVYSYIDATATSPAPTEVTFSLNGSRQLVETRYSAYSVASGYWAFNTTPYRTQILTGTVLTPGTGELSLFTYQTSVNGTALTCPTTGLTQSQILQVAAVQVTMKIKSSTGGSNSVTLTNTVGLPNLDINRTGQDI